jgi:hypothetical protein
MRAALNDVQLGYGAVLMATIEERRRKKAEIELWYLVSGLLDALDELELKK